MEEGVLALLQVEGTRRLSGQITSVYNNTINLTLDNGACLVLASGNTMLAPQMIRLGRRINFRQASLQLKPGKPMHIIGKKIYFNGNVCCTLTNAEIISLKIPELKLHNPDRLRYEINKLLLLLGKPGGFRNPWLKLQTDTSGSLTLQETALYMALVRFSRQTDAEDKQEEQHFFEQTRELVGLGSGLTPSGDDFLTGFFAVIGAFDPHFQSWRKARKDHWLRLIDKRTTGVSYEMLKHVLEGKVNKPVLDLLMLFTRWETPEELIKPVRELLELGSSSGTDMLTGMQFGLDYIHVWKEREPND